MPEEKTSKVHMTSEDSETSQHEDMVSTYDCPLNFGVKGGAPDEQSKGPSDLSFPHFPMRTIYGWSQESLGKHPGVPQIELAEGADSYKCLGPEDKTCGSCLLYRRYEMALKKVEEAKGYLSKLTPEL